MNYVKLITLALLSIFLANCSSSPPVQTKTVSPVGKPQAAREAITESKKRYSGNTCEEEDDRKHDCVDQCRDIYTSSKDRRECEELPIRQIAELKELYDDFLEDPDYDDLTDIDLENLETYLKISDTGFEKLIGKYQKSEVKDVFLWIAENSEVAKIISDTEDEYGVLKKLLKELQTDITATSTIHQPFLEKITSGSPNKLMEVVVDGGNEVAAAWFQEYILEEAVDCKTDDTGLECFKAFCRIGKGMDDDIREEWINIDTFFNYIDDIIDEGTNGAASPTTGQWDTDLIEEAEDITDFYEQLCNNTW